MLMDKFLLSCLEENYGGPLPPKYTYLFYYDIGFDSEVGYSFNYQWNERVENFLLDNNIVIDHVENSDIPQTFEMNKIFFCFASKDNENKAVSFFRHLRNAFSHYNIGYHAEYFCMKDFNYDKNGKRKGVTMIGKIDCHLFEEIIKLFWEQKAEVEEKINKTYNPII